MRSSRPPWVASAARTMRLRSRRESTSSVQAPAAARIASSAMRPPTRPPRWPSAAGAVTGYDDGGPEPIEALEEVDPETPVRVGVGEDGEEAILDEVAREQDALPGEEGDLVAARVRRAESAKVA